jgi:DNA-binding MarR family transcriptional regulator
MSKAPAPSARITKREFESLAEFRYELRRYLRYSEEITRKKGVTPLQYQLLLQLKGYPDREHATVSELAERLQAKHHGVVSLITRCEQAGLVVRRADNDDLRVVNVHLTAKGQQCLERLAELHRNELVKLKGRFFVPEFDDPNSAQ